MANEWGKSKENEVRIHWGSVVSEHIIHGNEDLIGLPQKATRKAV